MIPRDNRCKTKFHSIRGTHAQSKQFIRETIVANRNVARSNWQQRHGAILHYCVVHVPMKTRDIYKYIHTIFNQKIIITFRFKFLRHLIEVSSFQGDCLKRYSYIEHDDHMEVGGGWRIWERWWKSSIPGSV